MTKTQIQVPEELFEELRAFAKQREWSLAETFRRGAELLLQVYPEAPDKPARERDPPHFQPGRLARPSTPISCATPSSRMAIPA